MCQKRNRPPPKKRFVRDTFLKALNLNLISSPVCSDLRCVRSTVSEHISTACKKASSRVGVLMRLRKLIPVKAKLRIYKAAILSYLTYCGLTWHFCKKSDSNKFEKINERCLRAVYNDWNTTYIANY